MTNWTSEFERRYKEKLLVTFQFAIDFFEEHNLNYFCAFGTAIGAIRHHNMIPWDDDIDIMMPREDYNRLLTLKEKFLETKYRLVSLEDDGFYLPFAKIYDSSTTLWESRRYPFIIGVYIDIMPLDLTNLSPKKYIQYYKKFHKNVVAYQCSLARPSLSEFRYDVKHRYWGNIYWGIISMFYPKCLRNRFKKRLLQNYFIGEGEKYISYSGVYGIREIYPKQWFSDYVLVPFSSFVVRCPIGYDQYLRQIYGNYMELPSIDKQVAHHGQYYINLDERLTINESLKRLSEEQ